ncbi:MAG: hypothetical protein KBH14_00225 [Vicinamibacteria bacterium]|jgi:hypothetical protein|nr:hypothetical protein [Vicinamibacteria bacterium]
MTFLSLTLTTLAFTATPDCSPIKGPLAGRVFTNADLDRLAACRRQAEAETEKAPPAEPAVVTPGRRGRPLAPEAGTAERDNAEADWRARWRSIDQKARHLRREARELRQEAEQTPRDPKKKPTGRRAPAILLSRAESLEAEARELEDEFQARARREGALPGWLRPRAY